MSELAAVTLEGRRVRVVPLAREHAAGLFAVSAEPALWRYKGVAPPASVGDMEAIVDAALAGRATGLEMPFAILLRDGDEVAGSSRYLDWQPDHGGIEVGWTWVGTPWLRTFVNTEAKLLLLGHAFEALGCERVTLKTDGRNERSQRAIERLGAKREGVLRRHRRLWDGYVRDTVYYGIVAEEWPRVRAHLEERLAAHDGSPS